MACPHVTETDQDDHTPGITITSPSGDWLNDVHLSPYDFAENHDMASFCFLGGEKGEDGAWIPMSIFVADHILARGRDEVMELLKVEAGRKWAWDNEDGRPLGWLPTGFIANLYEAVTVMCAISPTKPKMTRG